MKTRIISHSDMIRNYFAKATAVVFLLISFSGVASSQSTTFSLDTIVAESGDAITFSVQARDLSNAGAITLYIDYDPAVLTFTGANNWNPLFNNGYNLANGLSGLIGIVWFDTTGVTASNVQMLDLNFSFSGGTSSLNFTGNCEIATNLGIVQSGVQYFPGLAVSMIDASFDEAQISVCPGSSTTLSPTVSGGYGTMSYQWYSDPAGYSNNSPLVSVAPAVPTTYYVVASASGLSDTASIFIDHYSDQPVSPVSSMIPADSATDLGTTVTLSWLPGSNASLYDVYYWKESDPVPATPSVGNLSQISVEISHLDYDTRYNWKVVSKNNCFDTTGPVQSFRILALPELHIVSMDHSLSKNGQAIQVTWTVRNDGNGPTTTPTWYERVWITPDIDLRVGENEDKLLGTYTNPSALAPGQSYTQTKTIQLPQSFIGTYFLFVVTDALDAILSFSQNPVFPNPYNPPPYISAYSHGGAGVNLVKEPNDSPPWYDNFFYKEITFPVPPLPDLQVQSVAAPVSSFSGQQISVNWNVKNAGDASTGNSSWEDKIYLSTDSALDNSDYYLGKVSGLGYNNLLTSLNPDSSYLANTQITLPNFIQGIYYVILHTDAANDVFEHAFDQNNTGVSGPIDIILTPPPDLVVTQVTAPDSASNKEDVLIKWSVGNLGATEPIKKYWHDAIYISPSSSFEDPSKRFLKKVRTNVSTFGPGNFVSQQTTVAIPDGINGTYYFFVETNVNDDVFEYLADTNNVTMASSPSSIVSPDLQPTTLTFPSSDNNGKAFQVNWDVKNNGPGDVYDKSWKDYIYLSPTPLYQAGISPRIGYGDQNQDLAAGASIAGSDSIMLPYDIAEGSYFMHLRSDAADNVYEHNAEGNNIFSSTASIAVTRPDLIVDSLIIPDTGFSGQPLPVSWLTINSGLGKAIGNMVEKVYISSSASYDPNNKTELRSFIRAIDLNPQDTAENGSNVVLPNGIAGNFYLYIATDAENDIPEGGRDNNNITRSPGSFYIQLSPYADLHPDTIQCPDTVYAGTYVDASLQVSNMGSADILGSNWQDELFIGTNPDPGVGNSSSLITKTISTPLEVDSSYTWTSGVKIPIGLQQGHHYIIGETDINNSIYEYTGDATNLKSKMVYVRSYPLDLTPTSLAFNSDTVSSTQGFTCTWNVSNIGSVPTTEPFWRDAIYLSSDTIFDANTDILLRSVEIYGPTAAGSSYSEILSVSIPYGYNGDFYLFVLVDQQKDTRDNNRVNNYGIVRDNSGNPKPIHVNELPSPDLVITSFEAPEKIYKGQQFKLKWTVTNQGPGDAVSSQGNWVDNFYLSNDFQIGNGDIMLGTKPRSNPLPSGASYTDSLMVSANFSVDNNFIVIAKTDFTNRVLEYQGEENNTFNLFTAGVVPPPSDLVLTHVSTNKDTIIVDGSFQMSWTTQNTGTNPATGRIHTGFYLSKDTILDNSDVLFASKERITSLLPGASESDNILAETPSTADGLYYLIGVTDLKNSINEVNDTNNTMVYGPVLVTLPILPLNVHIIDTLQNLDYMHWRIDIPDSLRGETILVELKADSLNGNNEMYIARNRVPSKIDYDHRQVFYFRGNQEVVIPEVLPGDYYLTVTGISNVLPEQEIDLFASKLEFEIRSYTPDYGGNTGNVTIQIDGSKFTPDMDLFIKNDTLGIIHAKPVNFVDPSRVFFTLTLNRDDWADDFLRTPSATGIYDLFLVKPGLDTIIVENGFEVVQGLPSELLINILHPPSVRANRYLTMSIQYANIGNTDITNPRGALISNGGAPIGLTQDDLVYDFTDLEVQFIDPVGPSGVLRPGSAWTIHIYTKSTSPLQFTLIPIVE